MPLPDLTPYAADAQRIHATVAAMQQEWYALLDRIEAETGHPLNAAPCVICGDSEVLHAQRTMLGNVPEDHDYRAPGSFGNGDTYGT